MIKDNRNRKKRKLLIETILLATLFCLFVGCQRGNKVETENEIVSLINSQVPLQKASNTPKKEIKGKKEISKKAREENLKKFPISNEVVMLLSQEHLTHNQKTIKEIEKLQKSAMEYGKRIKENGKDLLFTLQYIRQGNLAYREEVWNLMAGSQQGFETYVKSKKSVFEIGNSLRENKVLYDPATNSTIDFLHMIATLNVHEKWKNNEEVATKYGDIAGWAGDCIQLAREAKEAEIAKEHLNEYMTEHIAKDGFFGSEDMLADIDSYNIFQMSMQKGDLSQVLLKYYEQMNEKKRFQLFLNYRFPKALTLEELKKEIIDLLLHDKSIMMLLVSQKENVSGKDYLEHRKVAGECFATYVWEQAGR